MVVSASSVARLWRAVKLNSETLLREFPLKGIPVNGVLMSALFACVRKMVSAAMNPPGVKLMPLNLIDAGPSSLGLDLSFGSPACCAMIGVLALLVIVSVAVLAAVLVVTASLAFTLASAAREFAAA